MSKYIETATREIIKTSKLYSDGKTQVPKQVIALLNLKYGSQIVWVVKAGVIYIESSSHQ